MDDSQAVSNISSVINQHESLTDGPVSVSQMLRRPELSDARGMWLSQLLRHNPTKGSRNVETAANTSERLGET